MLPDGRVQRPDSAHVTVDNNPVKILDLAEWVAPFGGLEVVRPQALADRGLLHAPLTLSTSHR